MTKAPQPEPKEEEAKLGTDSPPILAKAPPHRPFGGSWWRRMIDDIDSIIARDPAARSRLEVALLYSGYHALLFYRISHYFYRHGWYFIARFISQFGRFITHIEIHPGAKIGKGLFIDHGVGVVIGETAELGDNVTLYQGVTLGGVSPAEDSHLQRQKKRHPTLGNGVIVGSGAMVLGPIFVGDNARIGANAVATHDIGEGETATGIPARIVKQSANAKTASLTPPDEEASPKPSQATAFEAYGLTNCDLPDPLAEEIYELKRRIAVLEERATHLSPKSKNNKA